MVSLLTGCASGFFPETSARRFFMRFFFLDSLSTARDNSGRFYLGICALYAELAIFEAFRKANVPEAEARAAAEAVSREIDQRYTVHAAVLATKADIEGLRADMNKQFLEIHQKIAESQRWVISVMFAGLAALALIQKLL